VIFGSNILLANVYPLTVMRDLDCGIRVWVYVFWRWEMGGGVVYI